MKHGIWDYDMPAAPILHDIRKDGKVIKAVTLSDQAGSHLRVRPQDGRARLADRGASRAEVRYSRRTRLADAAFPHPARAAARLGYSEEDLIDFTPALREEGKQMMPRSTRRASSTRRPLEITPTNKGTWLFPGTGGGPNWNGASVDPDTDIMYTPVRLKPQVAGLRKGDPKTTNMHYYGGGGGAPINGPQGLPIMKPPYSN